ncbi:MAG: hypothetical protein LR008_03435 [Candidatus Pacebacteria bacterium]|nr:hypothetical protein [Candidatus Paceibacterota bacterium]
MSLQILIAKITTLLFVSGLFFIVFAQYAQAAPTLILDVTPSTVVNGQEVTVTWYIDGSVSNCSINNGIGVIDVSTLPAISSVALVPPDNSSTDYTLNCDGGLETVTVVTEPTVILSLPGGNTETIDVSGKVDSVDIDWTSSFATKCERMWYEEESFPGVRHYIQWWQHNTYEATFGQVGFYGTWGGTWIDENVTFYLECINETTGASTIGSVPLTVIDPPPPNPPTVTAWTDSPSVSISTSTGLAYTDFEFVSSDVSSCSHKAYYMDGSQYTTLPIGFGYGSALSYKFNNIQISTSTDFEVTCSRPELTIGTTTYPAVATSSTVRVLVDSLGLINRGNLPPVTISLTATPTPATKDPDIGQARIWTTISPRNADYCLSRAYDMNGVYQHINGWTENNSAYSWDRRAGDSDSFPSFFLSSSTRLVVECRRQADYLSASTTLYELGTETVELTIEVLESLSSTTPPQAHVYGNVVNIDAATIRDTATGQMGFGSFNSFGSYPDGIHGNGSSTNSITFPFKHPYKASDTYDIYARVCDEAGGQSTFGVHTSSDGLVGTYTTNDPYVTRDNCWGWETLKVVPVATGVVLSDGDPITITCSTASDTEKCTLNNIYLGAGDGGSVAIEISTSTGFGDVSLMWMSEYTSECLDPHMAETIGGATYVWSNSGATYGFSTRSISTTTDFKIECKNLSNDRSSSMVTVAVPTQATLVVSALVSTGECIDPDTLLTVDTPIGYMAGTSGLCVPAVDLASASPAVSVAGATENNIDGTYDNLDTLIVIENLGPGELAADSDITYAANMTIQPVFSLPMINSLVGHYNDVLVAPIASTSPTQSVTLTRAFNGVPFGTHTVCSKVNLDGAPNFPEFDEDKINNTNCRSVTLPVPRPPMSIGADRETVRVKQSASINWSVNVSYELLCTVQGAGGLNEVFNTIDFPNPYTSTFNTGEINSTSEFVLQCVEPITNTVFTESVKVEVVPDYQEL